MDTKQKIEEALALVGEAGDKHLAEGFDVETGTFVVMPGNIEQVAARSRLALKKWLKERFGNKALKGKKWGRPSAITERLYHKAILSYLKDAGIKVEK